MMAFKLLVFGTFGEMSSKVRKFLETPVEYGVEHMGRSKAATNIGNVK
jgi:hypothetical protein